jgi:lipopolysaccharide transport system permease protein
MVPDVHQPTKTIEASVSRVLPDLVEVWQHRELLVMFIRRQISSRYRQMLLGVLWGVIEPLGLLLMMTLVFGFLLRVSSDGYPYPVFVFSGMAGWLLFSRATVSVAGSLLENMGLISKVYFPRLILPIAAMARELFDGMLMMVVLLLLAAAYGFEPTLRHLALPLILMAAALLAMAIGLWFAALLVKFRDIRPLLTLALQAGMYATPIIYSINLVPERFRFAYELHPMLWVVEFSRWALLGKEVTVTSALYWSAGASALLLVGGLIVFTMFERLSVDVQ